mgnify:FL=1
MKLKLIIGIVGILSACGFTNAPSLDTNQEKQDNNWVIGPFLRPEGVNPVISPQPTEFYCPMRKQQVKWEESDTFNPAATVKDGKIEAVEVTSAEKEDGAYLAMAEDIIPKIIEAQSAEVDTISGATFSSTGIKNASEQALEQAVK